MKLTDTISNGSIGVYSLENVSEQEAINHMFDVDSPSVNFNKETQTKFAEAVRVLFPGISLQTAWHYADTHNRKDGETFISKIPYSPQHKQFPQHKQLKGAGKKYIEACINLPQEFDRKESCRSDWFSGAYNAGTIVFMEVKDSKDVIYATLNISRFYGVCGQHEMDIVAQGYKKTVVDDIVDKLGEQQHDQAIRSPVIDQTLNGVFIPGFTRWEEFLQAYKHASDLLIADSWNKREWDAIRRDSLAADNPVIRGLSAERYQARLSDLVTQ
ncbi:hypothetical protein HZA96_05355 [Candidatus Woesearchaeota archaeon]|nr:hypothetical protein [Candidatus Woesearchaeota archaeon]